MQSFRRTSRHLNCQRWSLFGARDQGAAPGREWKICRKYRHLRRARARQNGNDFARTNANGEFVLNNFAEGYFPDFVQVGEQHKTKPARIVSRNPLILQEVPFAEK